MLITCMLAILSFNIY